MPRGLQGRSSWGTGPACVLSIQIKAFGVWKRTLLVTQGYVGVSARVCGHKLLAFFLVLNLRNDLLNTIFIYFSSLRSRTIIKGMKSLTVFHFSDPELDKSPPTPSLSKRSLAQFGFKSFIWLCSLSRKKGFYVSFIFLLPQQVPSEAAPQSGVRFPCQASCFLHPSTSAKSYMLDAINEYQLCFTYLS